MRIRLEMLLFFFLDALVLVPLPPLVVGRSTFARIDAVLIWTLATHGSLALEPRPWAVTKHAWKESSKNDLATSPAEPRLPRTSTARPRDTSRVSRAFCRAGSPVPYGRS